jgi:hypothetical protein
MPDAAHTLRARVQAEALQIYMRNANVVVDKIQNILNWQSSAENVEVRVWLVLPPLLRTPQSAGLTLAYLSVAQLHPPHLPCSCHKHRGQLFCSNPALQLYSAHLPFLARRFTAVPSLPLAAASTPRPGALREGTPLFDNQRPEPGGQGHWPRLRGDTS